ncbi:MAG: GDP-mannose 4,6-dehydratase [Candidatus Latescibacteria bacterium]|nr:GDP-mannose 4,6-dehydratase [Candidatus Latescibacterota bacterium]
MRFIVTGSNGFIGQNTCRRLTEIGHGVIGVDDLSSGTPPNGVEGVQYHAHSVVDADWFVRLLKNAIPDAVLHLAAKPRVPYSVRNPLRSAEANAMGTLSVLNGILKAGLAEKTRLVFASSSAVCGEARVLPTPETYPSNPQSPYALAKLQGEQWCDMFHRLYGLDVVSLRYFNVFGPGALYGGDYSTVLSAWPYHLFVDPSNQPFLEGDGTQTRDFCFVDNVVEATIAASTRERGFGADVLNVGQGEAHSLLEVKDVLEQIAGRELPLERRPPRVGDVAHTLADISRAREELGFEPSIDFHAQVERTAIWHRDCYPPAVR